ncbi:hypothetical protein PIB30_105255 [Stylosanthes scabra]|uniref:Uncharacterized protein n=1 Tax=Stylosanthes scabra TaxID=79078 RepID=A0ABU6QZ43_9FABA|nr:hypothetical protein [Stylosanthes scabra]
MSGIAVMDATLSAISEQKQKQKKKNKKKEVTAEAMAMEERMIKDLCRCICDLEFILCSENVPEAVKMVNGARVKMEVVLGIMMYQMQGIRLLVGKNNHGDDHVMWYKLKSFIADLWKIQEYAEFASSIY